MILTKKNVCLERNFSNCLAPIARPKNTKLYINIKYEKKLKPKWSFFVVASPIRSERNGTDQRAPSLISRCVVPTNKHV